MCDVRKSVVRLVLTGLAAGLLAGALTTAKAQVSTQVHIKPRRQQARARRETNASRQARIARNIQETYSHRYEVFGGGGFERFRPGEYLKKDSQISWAANTTYYFSPTLGIVASAQGSFGHATTYSGQQGYTQLVPTAQINEYFFMAGPNYRFFRREKFALSAQAQGGIGWGIFGGGSKDIPPTTLGIWPDEARPAFSLGLNADYNFFPNLAVRITPAWLGTTFGGNLQNNVGFNAGVIYRFGKQ